MSLECPPLGGKNSSTAGSPPARVQHRRSPQICTRRRQLQAQQPSPLCGEARITPTITRSLPRRRAGRSARPRRPPRRRRFRSAPPRPRSRLAPPPAPLPRRARGATQVRRTMAAAAAAEEEVAVVVVPAEGRRGGGGSGCVAVELPATYSRDAWRPVLREVFFSPVADDAFVLFEARAAPCMPERGQLPHGCLLCSMHDARLPRGQSARTVSRGGGPGGGQAGGAALSRWPPGARFFVNNIK